MNCPRLNLLAAAIATVLLTTLPSPGAEPAAGEIVVIEIAGKAETLRLKTNFWAEVHTNDVLVPGDRFRTKPQSRATLLLSDRSRIRVGEQSEIQVVPTQQPGTLHKLWHGLIYLFHRDKPGQYRLDSPGSSAAVRGTEFVMQVDDNGRTTVTVFDGEVALSNAVGVVSFRTGQQGVAEPGRMPFATALLPAQLADSIQWVLYYPGILHLPELQLTDAEAAALRDSLAAWREGDLVAALERYPENLAPQSDAVRLYRAGLWLAVGKAEEARLLLAGVRNAPQPGMADALRRLIDAVQGREVPPGAALDSATALLAESYVRQSRSDLLGALEAALEAVRRAPDFAFGHARVAELEFSHGRIGRSEAALDKALALSPRNAQALALRGFLAAARDKTSDAITWFDRAIAADGALGNAWLGRGLCRIRQGRTEAGVRDLETACTLEPQRAVLRSYLGKGFEQARHSVLATNELQLAIRLDERDPTPWLYRALLERGANRINAAVASLERSSELNDNRSLYRSKLLLDQDRAVRGANIARIYQDAGMNEVSLGAAARAVAADYANASTHLFLADSYDALRDPTRFNLRYETIWFNELLLGNLLAPVGAGQLSQHVSQQEYSRLFERDRLGLFSSTEFRSDGQFRQLASQTGLFRNSAWSLDLDYQHNNGVRPNNDLDRIDWYSTLQHQFTPHDSALLIVRYQDYESGDNFQYYDPADARPHLRVEASQTPTLLAGYHHEWAPGVHSLVVGGRLQSDQHVTDRHVPFRVLQYDTNAEIQDITALNLDVKYRSQFEAYTAEGQQIFQVGRHSLLLGARYQTGEFRTSSRLTVTDPGDSFYLDDKPLSQNVSPDFERITGYGYYTLQPFEPLRVTAGIAYDHVEFPTNFRQPPIQDGTRTESQLGPKAGLVWSVTTNATLRAAYSRSLGGVSFDESVRLEPAQLAGFGQAFRTIIPESVAGSVSAPTLETIGAALDLRLPATRTYFTLQGDALFEDVNRDLGAFALNVITPVVPTSLRQRLNYEEHSVSIAVNQLLGQEWGLGAMYRYAEASLDTTYPGLPADVAAQENRSERSHLHHTRFYVAWQHPSGFFSRFETDWYSQVNSGYAGTRPGDDFFQHNLYAGYRFPRRRAEILLGVLNLGDQDYRLNPLNLYYELPRERVFYARLKFEF